MRFIDSYVQGKDNNYNLLRFFAASLVLFFHCYPLASGIEISDPLAGIILYPLGFVGVFIFFVISGFLVTKSFFSRESILVFAEARFLRIFPALAVAVLFCIVVVGALFTTLPLREYASHGQIYRFFLHNVSLYKVHFQLPGVFHHNPYPSAINGSLWTMPYEIAMYFIVGILGGLSLLRKRIFLNGLYFGFIMIYLFLPGGWVLRDINLRILPFAFASGMFLYLNRKSIPLNSYIALALWCLPVLFYKTKIYPYVFQVALTYAVIWFVYIPAGFIRSFNKIGDYSYGIYIYAFPIQQSIAALIYPITPLQMFPLAFGTTLAIAILSWHLIEKPSLQLKGRFTRKLMERLN